MKLAAQKNGTVMLVRTTAVEPDKYRQQQRHKPGSSCNHGGTNPCELQGVSAGLAQVLGADALAHHSDDGKAHGLPGQNGQGEDVVGHGVG